ncbi:CaiB/BaiF CoA transferase family protein [Coraliomargarita akajimensis]|uniref:L-carnitine dehydratase/bile acid-inducible protein F n=1 Tax=Coraliomargarita akajimensis (strain DSM 45221 / IAM 15411 / JCM 23193 / KCTC 12865 / 04OKA010-24) TaxID=583355 RepID=D5ELS1_CORAD|nr:CaiB/BaiF CoA-transferase family protein [Coraliomargarita akajimensis]ADE53246.1 L-carnitine dehydratase/bile acid-inducible protein F [Coraliomargarita akajimensis DSM 45221]
MLKASLPLEGITVVDFSQFLSAPSASLRLADMGARVIKVERPETGDICRQLYVSNTEIDGESTIFHAINRNKESYCADLKDEADCEKLRQLVAKADVVMHNFRPSVMKRLGFDYESVKALNPEVVYGVITGYGKEGPWAGKPGQDLLVQSLSGLTWLSGNRDDGPVPMGLAIADIFAGAQLCQGILAALVRRGIQGKGGLVEISMLESILDFQFEPLTVHFQDGGEEPERTASNNAHPLVGAPYGVYETADGYLALAMGLIPQLGELLNCPALEAYTDHTKWFTLRDEIKGILADHLRTGPTDQWLPALEAADIWCAKILDWNDMLNHEGFKVLDMLQTVERKSGVSYGTTRVPIKFGGVREASTVGSPAIGEHNEQIEKDFLA